MAQGPAAELVAILEDTLRFANNADYVDTRDIYSAWASQDELIAEIEEHLQAARDGRADLPRLTLVYAPTAGLCEIATSLGASAYMRLARRFDRFRASVKPI